ncbi:hypothetical protein TELCIR_02986 [Teladorsagia circumcincta]|uniref:Uncharacterized protein n=1 Tax=Teladorsagia circumcincta TaxID=45464 RepID=A0A2G9UXX6_TELCI|nr:hypothetical protein TELCIR_02986 [Teladorsagia circumcincta]
MKHSKVSAKETTALFERPKAIRPHLAFYPLNMTVGANYTVCYANESDDCSDGLLDTTSIQDHLHYFNVDVSAYGINGCNVTMDPTNVQ